MGTGPGIFGVVDGIGAVKDRAVEVQDDEDLSGVREAFWGSKGLGEVAFGWRGDPAGGERGSAFG